MTASTTPQPTTHAPAPGSQLRAITALAAIVTLAAVSVGVAAGATVDQWLTYLLVVGLIIWIGGAITGQILLAHALDRDAQAALALVGQIMWIVPRVYVPLGTIAVAAGLTLAVRQDLDLAAGWILIPTALYAATAVLGTTVSAPGYVRLARLAERAGPTDPSYRRGLLRLAWLNRTELALVLLALLLLVTRPF
jgi:hypothetical protein